MYAEEVQSPWVSKAFEIKGSVTRGKDITMKNMLCAKWVAYTCRKDNENSTLSGVGMNHTRVYDSQGM